MISVIGATQRTSGQIDFAKRVGDVLKLVSAKATMYIKFISDDIVRICATTREEGLLFRGEGLCEQKDYSKWSYEETPDAYIVKTAHLTLCISKASAAISYSDENGKLLFAENAQQPRVLDEFRSYKPLEGAPYEVERIDTPDGVKEVVHCASMVFDKNLYHTKLNFCFAENEHIYGLGQSEEDTLNLRGSVQYLHQANMKIAIPFFMSTNLYGVLFDTQSPAIFRDDTYGTYFYSEADCEMNYYFMRGNSFDNIISHCRSLCGKAVMLPAWAFGFMQSQERYENADDLLSVAKEYRRRGVPIDCMVQDWSYWEDGKWGQKSFDKSRYSDPEGLCDAVHSLGMKLMISIWPNPARESEDGIEFAQKKLLLPQSNIYNAFDKAARDLYWAQAKRGIFDYGFDAWWCDSSEPFSPEWDHAEKPIPERMYYEFTEHATQSILIEKCNAYPLLHAKGIYEGQRRDCPEKRVVNLTRSAYIGQQKYAAVLWSGDISATWETLHSQIASGLNFCASSLPYWTFDIGAFFVRRGREWFRNGDYEMGTDDALYRELFVRWFQTGAFLPVFRSHGTDFRREIWKFGEEGTPYYDALVKTINLRYSLSAYIYSAAFAVWQSDYTLLRLLAFDFTNDEKALDTADEFMFGESLLVCPITKPADEAKEKTLYLPASTRWYDFYTHQSYEGGCDLTFAPKLDEIPLYVREGSIIPITPSGKNMEERLRGSVEFLIFCGKDAEFTLYEDACDGYGYEKGEYSLTHITWSDAKKTVSVKYTDGKKRDFKFTLVGYEGDFSVNNL